MNRTRLSVVLALLAVAATAPVLASGGGEGGEGLGKLLITPHVGTVVWTLVTFLCMVFILGKYAWKPLLGAIEDRATTIQDNLDGARRGREEAEAALAQHRELVAEARRERAAALAAGRQDAEKLKAEIVEEAKQQREQLLAQTREQVESSMRQARAELRATVTELAILGAGKLLSRNLDDPSQRKLVEEHLTDLERERLPGDSSGSMPS